MSKLTLSLVAAGALLASGSAMAGLTLCQTGYPDQINVTCNGNDAVPIPKPTSTGAMSCANLAGITNLPWAGIWIKAGKPSNPAIQCTFTGAKSGALLGKATVTLNSASLLVSQAKVDAPKSSLASGVSLDSSSQGVNDGKQHADVAAKIDYTAPSN